MADHQRRDVTNKISLSLCAVERGRSDLKTDGDAKCELRLFAGRSGDGSEFWIASEWHRRKHGERVVLMCVSPVPFRLLLGYCFGAVATPGGTAPFCFPDSSPRASLGPCSRKHGLALGSRAHLHGFAQV
jgi:hypothetical protein